MATHTMKQISASYWEIKTSGRKIGFVTTCPTGFVARIGKHCETGSTPMQAFKLVSAKAFGFSSPADKQAYNARMKQRNAALRSEARHVVGQLMHCSDADQFMTALQKLREL